MKVKSTGLGKTQLTAHFDGFTAKEGGEPSAVLIITSTEPVHWHIECDLGGSDLRQFAGSVLRPGMIWHLVKLLVRGGDASGFVMEKEGGRRSQRERVTRDAATVDSSPVEVAVTVATEAGPLAAEASAPPASPAATPAPSKPARVHASAKTNGDGAAEREERERQRAERRRQREEAAREHATALQGD